MVQISSSETAHLMQSLFLVEATFQGHCRDTANGGRTMDVPSGQDVCNSMHFSYFDSYIRYITGIGKTFWIWYASIWMCNHLSSSISLHYLVFYGPLPYYHITLVCWWCISLAYLLLACQLYQSAPVYVVRTWIWWCAHWKFTWSLSYIIFLGGE